MTAQINLLLILKALSGLVSYIDPVQHGNLLSALSRLSLWDYAATYRNYDATDIMDALIELIVSLCTTELLNRNTGNQVVEKLDNLIVLTFLHLESCQSSGRLTEVFDILLKSFKRTVLNTYKSKFVQFVMFYACALDSEGCDWCSAHCKSHDSDMNPQAHKVFYSACQVRLPNVVEEFLKQAKAARLFMSAELFVFDDFLEADLSKAFGRMNRLDMVFPFDPCLLKKSESYVRPHFVRWSRVRTTYDTYANEELSESGSEASDDNFVDMNTKDMIDYDMTGSVDAGLDFDPDLNKMSITPKSTKYGFQAQMEQRLPSKIRLSTTTSRVFCLNLSSKPVNFAMF